MTLTLDRSSQPARLSRINFFGAFGADSYCQLSWQGFYERFVAGRSAGSISRDAGRTPREVLRIYDTFFKPEVFRGREYLEYCDLLTHSNVVKEFPDDPTIRFVVAGALAAGMVVTPLFPADHAGRVQKRHLKLNDRLCSVHSCETRCGCEIMLEPLERLGIQMVSVVLHNPEPVRGMIIETDIVRKKLPRVRGGTHVRLDPRKQYAGSIILPKAA